MTYTSEAFKSKIQKSNRLVGLVNMGADEIIFAVSYGLWLIAALLLGTFFASPIGTNTLDGLRCLGLAGIALSTLVMGKWQAAEVLAVPALFVCALVMSRSGAQWLLDLVLLVYCARHMNFRIVAKETLWLSLVVLFLTILACKIGIIRNYRTVTYGANGAVRAREYLGFLYALIPAQIMFNITCLVVYLKGKSFNLIDALFLSLVNFYIYVKTDSRLSFFLTICLVLAVVLINFVQIRRFFLLLFERVAPAVFVCCFGISWIITANYPKLGSIGNRLNSLLGGRLWLGFSAISKYGTSLLGQKVSFIGNGLTAEGHLNKSGVYNYVDCLYVRLPVLYGWVFTALFVAGMTLVIIAALKNKDIYLCLVLVVIALHCVVDDLSIRPQYCAFLILMGISFVEAIRRASKAKNS